MSYVWLSLVSLVTIQGEVVHVIYELKYNKLEWCNIPPHNKLHANQMYKKYIGIYRNQICKVYPRLLFGSQPPLTVLTKPFPRPGLGSKNHCHHHKVTQFSRKMSPTHVSSHFKCVCLLLQYGQQW